MIHSLSPGQRQQAIGSRVSSGDGSIDPATLSPKFHFKADAGTFTDTSGVVPTVNDGDPVALWQDQSGNGNHVQQATGSKQPTWKLNIQNGLPMVRGDGTDDILPTPASVANGIGAGDWWVGMIVRPRDVVGNYNGIFGIGNYSPAVYVHAGSVMYYYSGSQTFTALLVDTTYLIEVWRVSSVLYCAVNGTQHGTTPANTNNITDQIFTLFSSFPTGGEYGDVDIGELVLITNLSSDHRTGVRQFLMDRWGL